MTVVPVTSADLDASEISWFAALCSDDYRHLGVPDGSLRSSFAHCAEIVAAIPPPIEPWRFTPWPIAPNPWAGSSRSPVISRMALLLSPFFE